MRTQVSMNIIPKWKFENKNEGKITPVYAFQERDLYLWLIFDLNPYQ